MQVNLNLLALTFLYIIHCSLVGAKIDLLRQDVFVGWEDELYDGLSIIYDFFGYKGYFGSDAISDCALCDSFLLY